jgi:putative ABC transport system permease protein
MEGGFSFTNFIVAGTVRFGSAGLDRGAVVIDLNDARNAFAMQGATGEILGYLPETYFDEEEAEAVKAKLNARWTASEDEFAPVAQTLRDMPGMGDLLDYTKSISGFMIFIFVSAMTIVLWNGGLLGGLRRYTEFGVRIALGEDNGHIYRSLLWEALMIGTIGSVIGTTIGVVIATSLNIHGIDISGMMKNATMLMPSIVRPAVDSVIYYIGFIPGVFSMVLGNALAGAGIYKRETARLFNELEV